ncbi:MAG: hypothetical protein WCS27_11710, partial [Victivallaceae bacterium]
SLTDVKYINMSISTSDQMIKHKFGGKLDRVSIINAMGKAVKLAKKKGIKAVGVNAEDASRTDMEYLIEFAQAAKAAGAMSCYFKNPDVTPWDEHADFTVRSYQELENLVFDEP